MWIDVTITPTVLVESTYFIFRNENIFERDAALLHHCRRQNCNAHKADPARNVQTNHSASMTQHSFLRSFYPT